MTSVNDIRRTFLDFFEKRGHTVVRSSPLIPANDPTLMFVNSGMVPFKNVFTGQEKRDYTRATSAQKCVRAGGKHNDLDNVGFTARHHTFFEMMGNFSFADYFKEQAIAYAWDMIRTFDIPKDRLVVTVYHEDEEAAQYWKKIAGFADDKIIRIATDDNFWTMGDTGPCGPCTEIFFDHGAHIPGGPPGSPDEDGDRFVEFWNNVFMQYEQKADGSRVPLAGQSIDTGMGLERMAAVLQGTHDNYAIDSLRALIEDAANRTHTDPDGPLSVSHRVIADHLRAAAFLIADGVLPANEGRGYVLRRIMRRGMRHAHLLGATDPLMHRLVPTLLDKMGDAYPELREAQDLVTATLQQEETRFKKTLDNGLHLLKTETARLGDGEKLSGEVAFKLYDTYGFPLDLTEDVLRREQNRAVDVAGFDAAMEKQRAAARASWTGSGEAATEQVWFDIRAAHGATEFLGYAQPRGDGKVVALVDAAGAQVKTLSAGTQDVCIVTNQTPFYAESGGQVGDTGVLTTASGAQVSVTDTRKKAGGLFVHVGRVTAGAVSVGDVADMQIDVARRDDIRANHSATHLLHAALRRHLGKHVAQKGSLVTADRLRFDISQPEALTVDQTRAVEAEVNARIRMNTEVTTRLMPVDDARAAGAIAMFGEKYDDEVRVLAMGGADPDAPARPYSMELCGGTHVRRTGDIGVFRIVGESALAAGVRRIEAVTGRAALDYINAQETHLRDAARLLKAAPAEVGARVEALLGEKKKLEKDLSDLRRKLAAGGGAGGKADVLDVGGVSFAARVLEDVPAGELKPLADDLKKQLGSGVVALVSVSGDGKASLVVGVTADLTARFSAVDLVKVGAATLGGTGGGGRPDMAQAGGPEGRLANDAVQAIAARLAS